MSLNFKPKTEEELSAEGLLPPGIYSFEVVKGEDKNSSAGNPMIVLDIKVFDSSGEAFYLKDYLLEKFAFKLRHFCSVTNLMDNYQQGTLSGKDCEGRTGHAKIAIEKGKPKDKANPDGEKYPDRNSIKDYVPPIGAAFAGKPAPTEEQLANRSEGLDEDAPF